METLLPFLPGFAAALGILILGGASPGPAVAMLLGISVEQGRQPALIACAGIAFGSATINILTLLGVGLILSQAAWAMMGLKLLGAAYLAWLSVGAFRRAVNPPEVTARKTRRQPPSILFAKGYALQVTNPKAIAFWLAIAAIGATEGASMLMVAAFVFAMGLVSFSTHAAWALALSADPIRQAFLRARRYIEGALGTFFAVAAFKLAISRT